MYLKVNSQGIITDCIDYNQDGYVEYTGDIDTVIHGGWHKLEKGVIVEQVNKNPNTIENLVRSKLNGMVSDEIDIYTMEMILGGLL